MYEDTFYLFVLFIYIFKGFILKYIAPMYLNFKYCR